MKDGILHFPNAEVFENHMFGLQEYKVIGETFNSLASVTGDFQSANLRLSEDLDSNIAEFQDTPLLAMLDQDGMVVIEDYFISLDFENKLAGVSTDETLVSLLRTKEFSNQA